jgi:hypothetical protein
MYNIWYFAYVTESHAYALRSMRGVCRVTHFTRAIGRALGERVGFDLSLFSLLLKYKYSVTMTVTVL